MMYQNLLHYYLDYYCTAARELSSTLLGRVDVEYPTTTNCKCTIYKLSYSTTPLHDSKHFTSI